MAGFSAGAAVCECNPLVSAIARRAMAGVEGMCFMRVKSPRARMDSEWPHEAQNWQSQGVVWKLISSFESFAPSEAKFSKA